MQPAIQISQLGKCYRIAEGEPEKYLALRDTMGNALRKITDKSKRKPVRYADFWALQDIQMNIQQGDRVAIIGSNGAGKSTLLKLISRITEPTRGSIRIRGRVASLLEVGTGFHPELTGKENIYLNGAILGMNRHTISSKLDEIIAFAEIEKFLHTPVKRYSSGMYVRLAFSVAAHLEPDILLVDEVLAVGDARFQQKCLGKMEEVSTRQGRTVLFVSHNMGLVSQLCHSAVLLAHGKLQSEGPVKQVIDEYLKSGDTQSRYKVDDSNKKANAFTEISLHNIQGESVTDVLFHEPLTLRFRLRVHEPVPGLQIGIGLEDRYNSRICTIVKEVGIFQTGPELYEGQVTLPDSLFAPNSYQFVFALWTRDGRVFDMVKNICPVTIHDNGTEYALYEGVDYGSVLIHPKWNAGWH